MDTFSDLQDFADASLRACADHSEGLQHELQQAIDYTLFSEGKRIRPVLCYLLGELFGIPKEKLVSLACALEMIHAASLLIDDLPSMDNGRLRRGKPANHLVYGEGVTILASIGLLLNAYETVLNDGALPAAKKLAAVRTLVVAVGLSGMVAGQYLSLRLSEQSNDLAALEYMNAHKTVPLLVAAAEIIASMGAAHPAEIEAVRQYAHNLGLGFQILDDLLDYVATREETGEISGKNNANCVTLLGVDGARQLLQRRTNDAVASLKVFEGRGQKLMAFASFVLRSEHSAE